MNQSACAFFLLFFFKWRSSQTRLDLRFKKKKNLAKHSKMGKKTRQAEEEVWRQHQGIDRPLVHQVPGGSGEHGKMEETGYKVICGSPMTLAVKGYMKEMRSEDQLGHTHSTISARYCGQAFLMSCVWPHFPVLRQCSQPTHDFIDSRMSVCSGVLCYLHFWQNDQGLLCATVVAQGWIKHQIRGRTKSELRRRMFSWHSCWDLNMQPFDEESIALPAKLSEPWNRLTQPQKMLQLWCNPSACHCLLGQMNGNNVLNTICLRCLHFVDSDQFTDERIHFCFRFTTNAKTLNGRGLISSRKRCLICTDVWTWV